MEEQNANTELEKARKRTATQEPVCKYRASQAVHPPTMHGPPMSGKERVRAYQFNKQQEAANANPVPTMGESPLSNTTKIYPSTKRTRNYRTRFCQCHGYVKPLPLTQKEHDCRCYSKKKQFQLESEINGLQNLNSEQASYLLDLGHSDLG